MLQAMTAGAAFPASAWPPELVQPGQGAFDRPALPTEAGTVRNTAAGDDRRNAACGERPTLGAVVVAAVGK
jgi:hypothetical protein